MVIEHCAEPLQRRALAQMGHVSSGSAASVDHIAVDDNWWVKYGVWEKLTDAAIADEHDAVKSNRFATDLTPAFDIAGIDFGRADHASIGGRTVVYEINTNPFIGPYVPDPKPLRRETQTLARQRFAEALEAIDTKATGTVAMPASEFCAPSRRAWRFGWLGPRRP